MKNRLITQLALIAVYVATPLNVNAGEFPPCPIDQMDTDWRAVEKLITDLYPETPNQGSMRGFGKLNDALPGVWIVAVERENLCYSENSFNGCPIVLIAKEANETRVIGILPDAWQPLIASPHKTNGWSDLIYWSDKPAARIRRYAIARYNGHEYIADTRHTAQAELRKAASAGRKVFGDGISTLQDSPYYEAPESDVETKCYGELASTDPQFQCNDARLSLAEALQIANTAASQSADFTGMEAIAFSYSCRKNADCVWGFVFTGIPRVVDGQAFQMSLTLGVHVPDQSQAVELLVPHICERQ